MEQTSIQATRMKEYFMQAAKKILKAEGVRGISARNIAKEAGYSYATLYNYFTDLNDLVFECVKDFQFECASFIEEKTGDLPSGKEKIAAMVTAYMQFFVQYPGIFELFFLERATDMSGKNSNIEGIHSFLPEICGPEWDHCVDTNSISRGEAELASEQLNCLTAGVLVFYLNRHTPETYKEFTGKATRQVRSILKI